MNEKDGTPDHSALTSVLTDGMIETSDDEPGEDAEDGKEGEPPDPLARLPPPLLEQGRGRQQQPLRGTNPFPPSHLDANPFVLCFTHCMAPSILFVSVLLVGAV